MGFVIMECIVPFSISEETAPMDDIIVRKETSILEK
jgi:hypothetical protein